MTRRLSATTRQRLSAAAKARWRDPTIRAKYLAELKRRQRDPQFIERHRTLMNRPEMRAQLRANAKAGWSDPKARYAAVPKWSRAIQVAALKRGRETQRTLGQSKQPTPFEKQIAALIPYRVRHQYRIGPYYADIYVPRLRLVIEADCEFWHGSPAAKASDRKRDRALRALGYRVVRIRYREFERNPQQVVNRALFGRTP